MDINELRSEINAIDSELTQLFNKRMRVALDIAKYKTENNLPVLDKTRERAVLDKGAAASDEEFQNYTRILYADIMSLSRSYQHKTISGKSPVSDEIKEAVETTPKLFPENAKVACQGVEGAYAQHACDRFFRYPKISYYDNWREVFEAV